MTTKTRYIIKKQKIVLILFCIFFNSFILCSCQKNSNFQELNKYKENGWLITDSVDILFCDNTIYGVAISIEKGNESGDGIERKLFVYRYLNSEENFVLLIQNSNIFGSLKWGIQESDPYGSISMRDFFTITFVSGDPINRYNWDYCFDIIDGKITLVKYLIREYNIMDVDENGTLIKEIVEEYDWVNNIHTSYKLINGKKIYLYKKNIAHKDILMQDINAEEFFKF